MFYRTWLLSWLLVAALSAGAWGRGELRLGGPDGTPWENLLTPGQEVSYVVVDKAGNILSTAALNTVEEEAGGNLLPDYHYRTPNPPFMQDNILQSLFIDPEVNLALDEVLETRNGHIFSSICHCLQAYHGMTDGDPETGKLVQVDVSPRVIGYNSSNVQSWAINLGAELPINRIHFYPRPGFEENYLAWYEVRVAGDDAPLVDQLEFDRQEQRWYR